VAHFLPASGIDRQWYDLPYLLGPDEGAVEAYFALAQALAHEQRQGIARWVMRKKPYVGALCAQDGYLMLITLKFVEGFRTVEELPKPAGGRPPDAKELRMAEQLISALQGEFRPEEFHDEYRERVMKFIESKASGQRPKLRIVARKKEPKSLILSLAASLDMAKHAKEKAVA